MRQEFVDSMEFLARAASRASDDNPPHVHVDEFCPVETWRNDDILALLRAVMLIKVPGKIPVVWFGRAPLSRHAPVPDSLQAIADLWRAAQEDPLRSMCGMKTIACHARRWHYRLHPRS